MIREVVIRAPFADLAPALRDMLAALLREGHGFMTTVAAQVALYPRMRARARGGPDSYAPLAPRATEAVLEAWHPNFRGEYFRCVQVRVRAEDGDHCRLTWDPADIRIDVQAEWHALLHMAANMWVCEPVDGPLNEDPYRALPLPYPQAAFATLAEVDAATAKVFADGFAPGFVRYERLAEDRESGDLVRYRIKGDYQEGGDCGEIWLRAGGAAWTFVMTCVLEMRETPLPLDVLQAIDGLPEEAWPRAIEALQASCLAEMARKTRRKLKRLDPLLAHYAASLPPEWFKPFRQDAAEALARTASKLKPRDKVVLAHWRDGYTAEEIGQKLGLNPRYVHNLVSGLRKQLGKEAVPVRGYSAGKR